MSKRRRQPEGTMVPVPDSDDELDVSEPDHILSSQYHVLPSGDVGVHSHVIDIPQSPNAPVHPGHENGPYDDFQGTSSFEAPPDELPWEDPAHLRYLDEVQPLRSRRRRVAGDFPLQEWLKDRERFLSEFLRLEGRGTSSDICPRCKTAENPRFRCMDCDGVEVFCERCIVETHRCSVLHRIEKWSEGNFFQGISLRSLGCRIQLGHPIGQACPSPERSFNDDFSVMDLNGIHDIGLDFCGCEHKQDHFVQVLRFGWFPATVLRPRSASTIRLLKFFHILSFESKASAFKFYQTIHRLTDNLGINDVKDRYRAFLRMVREYRHLKMLKRGGRGHDPGGAASTQLKQLAVMCPACPQPGVNLPPSWKDAPAHRRFLYALFLAIDANFRLKRKKVSSHASDPSLSKGWAYFVDEDDYIGFLERFGKLVIQDPSTCSKHSAVDKERGKEGLASSGNATCDCARHDFKRPVSVGDLQKGECYLNMDYLFFSGLQDCELVEIIVSYDIACQWGIHLWDRMALYPRWMHVDHEGTQTFRFLVPKFHLPAHVLACQTTYSFNYNANVGRTDGEGVERGWSNINPVSASTREMGPGSRRDTLDDHYGDWNWKKTCHLRALFLRRVRDAVPEMVEREKQHTDFTRGLLTTVGDSDDPLKEKRSLDKEVGEWMVELALWESDHTHPNPFQPRFKALSFNAVRHQLADQEAEELQSGSPYVMHEDVSASQLISMGLDLENQQRRISVDHKSMGAHATDDQKAKIKLRSNTLRRKIDSWIQIQQMYIPSLRVHRTTFSEALQDRQEELLVGDIPLILPSGMPSQLTCDKRLQDIEWRLRESQATDALDDLRENLRLRAYVSKDKKDFQRGQRANTRSQGVIDRIQVKVSAAAARYRVARSALLLLAPRLGKIVTWESQMPVLKEEDVRPLSVDLDPSLPKRGKKRQRREEQGGGEQGRSEGRRTVSWIWTRVQGSSGGDQTEDDRLHESLRIEWCKSKARQDRWKEEVMLLQEEIRRVLASFEHRAQVWDLRASNDTMDWVLPGVPFDPLAIEGRSAYAREQGDQFRRMRECFAHTWRNVDSYVESGGENVDLISQELALDLEDSVDIE